MTWYGILVVIHLIAAVIGLGASFALPVLMSRPKTVSQAKFAHHVAKGIENFAKIGSLTLLATGIIMGILNTYLFTQIWFIASIIIYVLIQPIVAGIIPKNSAKQLEILEKAKSEELPQDYILINKKMAPLNNIVHAAAVILIILMSVKPF
jgi:uncharacterized membrane protein